MFFSGVLCLFCASQGKARNPLEDQQNGAFVCFVSFVLKGVVFNIS